MRTTELTKGEAEIMLIIQRHMGQCGMPPSKRQIALKLGLESRSYYAVRKTMSNMRNRGLIAWRRGSKHTLRLTEKGSVILRKFLSIA